MMELSKMYKGIEFSPVAMLTANISATDTVIPVSDVTVFPDAPNIATIGTDIGAETIIYANISEGALTGCTRGIEGTAKEWSTDEIISRNFTAKDHNDIIKNIEELYKNKLDAEYKVEVINTNDINKTGKALDAIQNNATIPGTLAKKISDNTEQINNLSKKTPFTCIAEQGYSITSQNCYTKNGLHYVNVVVTKTDNSAFSTGYMMPFCLPFDTKRMIALSYSGVTSNGVPSGVGSALASGSRVYFTNTTANITQAIISGVVAL